MKRKPADLAPSQAAPLLPPDYPAFLSDIKARIHRAQMRAALAANHELILLYWDIGCSIAERQKQAGWGAAVIPRLARDIRNELPVVDDRLRHAADNPTIGLILCREKNRLVAEYALKGVQKAIGVSEYQFTRVLPTEFQSSLPTVEQIETELECLVRGNTAAKGAERERKKTGAKRPSRTGGKAKRTRTTK